MNGLTIKYMERTYEELRSMSQEDLVRLVLDLQDDCRDIMNHFEALEADLLSARDKLKEALTFLR